MSSVTLIIALIYQLVGIIQWVNVKVLEIRKNNFSQTK